MNVAGHGVQKHVERPNHPVPRKYMEPILYLAERMSQHDRILPPPATRTVDALAEMLGLKDFRRQPWFRQMNEQRAAAALDLETAKRATLVVLTLVMKTDTTLGESAKRYFTELREMLGADPIAVPADLAEHKDLVERFLVG